jgi:superfamily II DNA or RNA helicase
LNAKTVIIVHSIDLLYQTRNVLENLLDLPVGVVGDGVYEVDNMVVVLSVDTLRSKFKQLCIDLQDTEMLIVDECHHMSSDSAKDLFLNFPTSPNHRRYGASGTPLRYNVLKDMQIIGTLGPIVYDVTNMDLIEKGFSTAPLVHMHPIHLKNCTDLDYDSAYRRGIVGNKSRNSYTARIAEGIAEYGPALVVVDWIRHAEDIAKYIGFTEYVVVTGHDSSAHRTMVLNRMRAGEKMVVITTIFKEGIDVPNIQGLVIACGGSAGSRVRLLQAIGRALRKKELTHVDIHDFTDIGNAYLEEHSAQRCMIYEKEGFNVLQRSI